MQKAVEDYLAKVKKDAEEATEKKASDEAKQAKQDEAEYKEKVLKAIGLTVKEYSPDGKISPDHLLVDTDGRHYRNAPIEVSAEEWEAIRDAYKNDSSVREALI